MMQNKITQISQGDVLAFRASDGDFKAIICTSVDKQTSPHSFTFAATNYSNPSKPKLEHIVEFEFYGIGNRKSDYFKYTDDELVRMWAVHPEVKPYFLGSYGLTIWRKDFLTFRDNFEMIGNLEIFNHLDKNGSGGMNAGDLNVLDRLFCVDLEQFMDRNGQRLYRLHAVITDKKAGNTTVK